MEEDQEAVGEEKQEEQKEQQERALDAVAEGREEEEDEDETNPFWSVERQRLVRGALLVLLTLLGCTSTKVQILTQKTRRCSSIYLLLLL